MKFASILLFFASSICLGQTWQPQHPLKSTSDIQLALDKMGVVGSVLYIAAHPDDENTRLLAWLAKEKKVETAYLSLTRGDGGQNLIGTEQGPELGLLRTQELLEARKIDGAYQFFTRAKDFGYSKNPEETFSIWNRDSILADVVKVIRLFQPDVIITRFPTTGEGGHGHHTASAILAGQAFTLAADPSAFPEQLGSLKPWQARRLLWNSFSWNRKAGEQFPGEIKINVGNYNPLLGQNYGEIAALARSKHRCQGFGSRLVRGESFEYVKNILGDSIQADLFEDINLQWSRIPKGTKIQQLIQQCAMAFNPRNPSASLTKLLEIKRELDKLEPQHWTRVKQRELDEIIQACTGFYADAYTSAASFTPGGSVATTIEIIHRSDASITLQSVRTISADTLINKKLTTNQLTSFPLALSIPASHPISQPNWLNQPNLRGTYPPTESNDVENPELRASLEVALQLIINDLPMELKIPVLHKTIDPSVGEVYQPLPCTPPASIDLESKHRMWYRDTDTLTFSVTALTDSVAGEIEVIVPDEIQAQWTKKPVFLAKMGQKQSFTIALTGKLSRVQSVGIFLRTAYGTYNQSEVKVAYPHIANQLWFPEASVQLHPLEIKGNQGLIGYIEGAGDGVDEALRQIGFTVVPLTENDLLGGNLARFKAIICGIRAYNTNEKMAIYQPALNKYVENGGTYLVQYQTNNFVGALNTSLGPKKLSIGRERVTNEEAAVKIIQNPDRIFEYPNRITEADFEHWVQERSLYHASEWSNDYIPLLEMADQGEKTAVGSCVYLKHGKGRFIYTGLSFFRQLPAGVEGAYRLLTNFIQPNP
ncbi:MAG TPA: PIG-L family deacetylase [Luteibaculaceae bacterium]|nr:PIG-L family deacetylase [Luteibaculaceae bacterium]